MFEIKWKQPQVVSRAQTFPESKVRTRRRAAVVSGVYFISAVGLVFSAGRELRTAPAIIGLMVSAVLLGLLSVYLPYWANQRCSREVGIGEKAIVLMLPAGMKAWRYEQISEVRFVHASVAGEALWIMMLGFGARSPVGLGVAKSIDITTVAERLRKHGVRDVSIAPKSSID